VVITRIVDVLTQCGSPFVALIAPAGFGKTHAASAFAGRFSRRAAVSAKPGMTAMQVMDRLAGSLEGDVRGPAPAGGDLDAAAKRIWGSPQPACVVIDAAEGLDDATLLDVLTALERFRPAEGTLVVCTRHEPELFKFSEIVAPDSLTVLRRADLELTLREVRSLGATANASMLYEIYHLTRGWPVPVFSLVRASVAGAFETESWHLDHPALNELFDWVDAHAVATLPDDVREVLLQCIACRDLLPADFDAGCAGQSNRVDRLLYRNAQHADIGFAGEIRVHPLIALTVRARHALDLKRLAREAAAAFLERGEPLRAARTMVSMGELERASAIVDSLDFDAARDLGGFAYPGTALERFVRTKPAYERYPLLWLNLVSCRYYAVGPKTLANEGADMLRLQPALPRQQRYWATAIVSMLFTEAGDEPMAECYATMLRTAPRGDADAVASLDLAEMYLDVLHGRYTLALERWNRLGSRLASSPVWYALHLRCAVRAEVRLGRVDAGEDALRTFSAVVGIGGCPSLAAYGAMSAAYVAWRSRDAAAFHRYRRDFAHLALHYDVPVLWPCLCAMFGDDFGDAMPGNAHDALAALILATSCTDDRAAALARQALLAADAGGDVAMRVMARIVAAASVPGDERELIAQARTLAQSTDSAALRELAGAQGPPSMFLQRASRVDAVKPVLETVAIDVATGEVMLDDRKAKVSDGTLQLLVFLALHGRMNRDAVVERLWPDLDGDAGSNALKICVHRARAQLGNASFVIVEKASCFLGTGVTSSYPYVQFIALRAAYPITEHEHAEFSAAFDRLARGLVSAWAPWKWFVPFTRSLSDAMRAVGAALANYELERNNPQAALQIARRMTGIAPLDESARSLIIRAYVQLGNPTAAVQEFEDFSAILLRETGKEPTPSLRRLLG
jgi:DNA-binding SARP family transcriptional activator